MLNEFIWPVSPEVTCTADAARQAYLDDICRQPGLGNAFVSRHSLRGVSMSLLYRVSMSHAGASEEATP
jgi:hypothetical protein